jgi:hypothetical protein
VGDHIATVTIVELFISSDIETRWEMT